MIGLIHENIYEMGIKECYKLNAWLIQVMKLYKRDTS